MDMLFIQPRGGGHPPLGLAYLAAVLEENGYGNIEIIDILRVGTSPVRTRSFLENTLKKAPDVVGVTSTTPTFGDAIEICRIAKRHCNTVIIGGIHATIFQERILEKYPFIDIVVYGEGEHTILEIMGRLEEGKNLYGVRGTIFRDNRRIIRNDFRQPIENLDLIPFPARHLLDLESYRNAFAMITSRGCPYNCVFCCNPATGKKWRGRSPENVVDEIEFLLSKYPRLTERIPIVFSDDNFNFNLERTKRICDEILARDLHVRFSCFNGLHVANVDYELFKKMKVAGCETIWFGIESGNLQVLRNLGKGITVNMVKRAVKLARKAGIDILGGHFIIGLPGDTLETVEDSIKLMQELELDCAGFAQAVPFPGTRLWDWVIEHGRFLCEYTELEDYENFRIHASNLDDENFFDPRFETPEFAMEERRESYRKATKELDKMIRRLSLSPKSILEFLISVRSLQDIAWASDRLYTLLFKENLRLRLQSRPL